MRLIKYSENEENLEFTMTVKMERAEWKKFDVRTFDLVSFHADAKRSVNPVVIQDVIYKHYGLNETLIERMHDAKKIGRVKRLVDIRRYCYYFIRTYTDLSFAEIGSLYGQDHATVMHHVKKVNGWLEFDTKVIEDVEEMRVKVIERVNPYNKDII